jgi:hypothetical protein
MAEMKPLTVVLAFATALLTTAGLSAQDAAREDDDAPSDASIFTTTPSRIRAAVSGPVRPVLKGVGPSGGIGIGVRADVPSAGPWQIATTAIVTQRRYWSLQLDTQYQAERAVVAAYARMRDMSQLNFFGPGPTSLVDDRTTFQLRDPVVGVIAVRRLAPLVSVGGRVEEMWPSVGRGRASRFPSIEERFG